MDEDSKDIEDWRAEETNIRQAVTDCYVPLRGKVINAMEDYINENLESTRFEMFETFASLAQQHL